ncbi:MAG TPA: HEAT repeat domain-containing protein [Actinobacteria bacterium]|nr:HEAT repeat domain-containing protein [Actinomycetota bacterium]
MSMGIKLEKALMQKKAEVQAVLQQLNLAFRSVQLYPDDHVIAVKNMVDLYERLKSHVQKYGQFVLRVSKDNIVVEDIEIDKQMPGAGSLALHLFRLKLESIVISEEIDEKQLKTFLQLICLDSKEVATAGGLPELLKTRKVTAVCVSELLLRVTGEAQITKTKGRPPVEPEGRADFSRLKQVVLAEIEPSMSDANGISNTIANAGAVPLAGFFSSLHPDSQGTEESAEVITNALSELDKLFSDSQPQDQAMLSEKLVEAILELGEPLLTAVAPHLLNANASESHTFASKLIAHFPDRELVKLIKLYSSAKDFSAEGILEEIKKMPLSFERLRGLAPLLSDEFSLENDLMRNFFKSILEKDQAMAKALSGQIQSENESASLGEDAKEIRDLKKEITDTATEHQIMKLAIGQLREVLAKEEKLSNLEKMAEMAVEILIDGLKIDEVSLAVGAVSILAEECDRRSTNEEAKEIIETRIEKACDKEKIEKILSLLDQDQENTLANVERYFKLTGGYATPALLDILVVEERRGRRRLICKFLTYCAETDMEGVASHLNDSRWFLVRNLVYVLGEIGDKKSIVYLEMAAEHEDVRVRLETITALSKLGPSTIEVLEDMLGDKDSQIKIGAVKALGKIKNIDAVDSLLRVIEDRDFFLRQVDLKTEAIAALGRLRAHSARSVLVRIAGINSWPFHARKKKLKEAATLALSKTAKGHK